MPPAFILRQDQTLHLIWLQIFLWMYLGTRNWRVLYSVQFSKNDFVKKQVSFTTQLVYITKPRRISQALFKSFFRTVFQSETLIFALPFGLSAALSLTLCKYTVTTGLSQYLFVNIFYYFTSTFGQNCNFHTDDLLTEFSEWSLMINPCFDSKISTNSWFKFADSKFPRLLIEVKKSPTLVRSSYDLCVVGSVTNVI